MAIILVDQDGVLADLEKGFLSLWQSRYPDRFYVPVKERTSFYIEDQYPKEFEKDIQNILYSKGFFRSLPIMNGGLEALTEMKNLGHEVFICTTPLSGSEACHQEKYDWIKENLGHEWTKRLILVKDKTLVYGNYLIDDRSEIKGLIEPSWEHILYDSPYNQGVPKRRITWQNWNRVKRILNL